MSLSLRPAIPFLFLKTWNLSIHASIRCFPLWFCILNVAAGRRASSKPLHIKADVKENASRNTWLHGLTVQTHWSFSLFSSKNWIEKCQRADLLDTPAEHLHRHYRLCGKHFEESSIHCVSCFIIFHALFWTKLIKSVHAIANSRMNEKHFDEDSVIVYS